MRGMDQETESIIGDMTTHGTKAGISGKWEARETSKVKVMSVYGIELILKDTGQFVSTEGGGQQSVGRGESLPIDGINYLVY